MTLDDLRRRTMVLPLSIVGRSAGTKTAGLDWRLAAGGW